ncbi:hypothetical protein [Kitasatospora sp. NPDC056181]|uniref:hypothetical protein n=1 Tax=Kitasatospora sp. NPDC056181 TaxID=3345737 RepID=UPI0035DDA84E
MNRDQVIDLIRTTTDAYFDLLDDPADVDTDDLADNIASALERAGIVLDQDGGQ